MRSRRRGVALAAWGVGFLATGLGESLGVGFLDTGLGESLGVCSFGVATLLSFGDFLEILGVSIEFATGVAALGDFLADFGVTAFGDAAGVVGFGVADLEGDFLADFGDFGLFLAAGELMILFGVTSFGDRVGVSGLAGDFFADLGVTTFGDATGVAAGVRGLAGDFLADLGVTALGEATWVAGFAGVTAFGDTAALAGDFLADLGLFLAAGELTILFGDGVFFGGEAFLADTGVGGATLGVTALGDFLADFGVAARTSGVFGITGILDKEALGDFLFDFGVKSAGKLFLDLGVATAGEFFADFGDFLADLGGVNSGVIATGSLCTVTVVTALVGVTDLAGDFLADLGEITGEAVKPFGLALGDAFGDFLGVFNGLSSSVIVACSAVTIDCLFAKLRFGVLRGVDPLRTGVIGGSALSNISGLMTGPKDTLLRFDSDMVKLISAFRFVPEVFFFDDPPFLAEPENHE